MNERDLDFFHFTDKRNLPLIKERGLLSWEKLREEGLQEGKDFFPCSNDLSHELDKRKGTQNYIRLCKSKEHPMLNRVRKENPNIKIVFLKISNKYNILNWKNIWFTNTNATKSNVEFTQDKDTFLKGDEQAEILISNVIKPTWINF